MMDLRYAGLTFTKRFTSHPLRRGGVKLQINLSRYHNSILYGTDAG